MAYPPLSDREPWVVITILQLLPSGNWGHVLVLMEFWRPTSPCSFIVGELPQQPQQTQLHLQGILYPLLPSGTILSQPKWAPLSTWPQAHQITPSSFSSKPHNLTHLYPNSLWVEDTPNPSIAKHHSLLIQSQNPFIPSSGQKARCSLPTQFWSFGKFCLFSVQMGLCFLACP